MLTCTEAQLPYPPRQGIDIHPKGPKSDVQLQDKKFLQNIRLRVHRSDDCQITDTMLAKGAAPGNMPLADVRLWIQEIVEERYTVVLATELPNHSDANQISNS